MDSSMILQIAIVALVVVIFGLWLFWQIKKKGLKQFAVDMIIEAEDFYNQGQNEEKMNYVIDKLIALVPAPLSLFITRESLKSLIQKVFDSIKKALDYQSK